MGKKEKKNTYDVHRFGKEGNRSIWKGTIDATKGRIP
jgi:hypothetical protein